MNEQEILDRAERAAKSVVGTNDAYERLLRRRDRKRRNQRISAGVVGIAVFFAAVWILTSVASLDRSEKSVVPGGAGTSGPTETGPAETGPTIPSPYEYDPTADYVGLPPEGTEPSGAERSELVAEAHPLHVGWVYVFEDGRVISSFDLPMGSWTKPPGITEQRLTPQGVELVRSGVLQAVDFVCFGGLPYPSLPHGCDDGPLHQIPPRAWEDSTLRPYVPYRYAICGAEPLEMFPVAAQDLLRGKEAMFDVAWTDRGARCFDVTTEEARTLDAILADAGFLIGSDPGWSYNRWVPNSSDPELVTVVTFEPILPHGTFGSMGGG